MAGPRSRVTARHVPSGNSKGRKTSAPKLRVVRWFRRSEETLNDRLLREAGYGTDGTALPNAEPAVAAGEGLLTGSFEPIRSRNWDITTPVEVPALEGAAHEFATLPDGSLIVDSSCEE